MDTGQNTENNFDRKNGNFLNACYVNEGLTTSTSTLHYRCSPRFSGSNDFMLINETQTNSSTIETIKSVIPWFRRKAQSACTKKTLYKRLPIIRWLPQYNVDCVIGDLVAGITVGLMVIPQALAYANIASLPVQHGLYTSFLGCFIYIFMGSCKDVPMGPTAIASLMTFQALNGHGVEHAILLCFLTGLVQILMGIFGLGFLIDFVSGPVSSGFTSAVALIIITSQVKDILGINASGNTFVKTWSAIFQEIHNASPWDAGLGACCIAFLLIMRSIGNLKLKSRDNDEELPVSKKIANGFLWFAGIARNAILVIVCGFVGYSFCQNGKPPFKIIGHIPPGLPEFRSPPFGYTKLINGTETAQVSLIEMIGDFGSNIFIVPIIGILEDIAICKAFGNGKAIDATQELLAIGLCNICNSFVQAFPGSGSLSRSPVNHSSGVKTPLGGLYTGLLVILSLLFLTPYFYYIPKCTLASVIIAAVIFLIEIKVIKPMWRSKKCDLILCIITFIACLCLPLEIGTIVGVGLNLLFILYHAARPKISVEKIRTSSGLEYLMLTPDRCLIFPSTDYVRNLVTKHSLRQGIPVIIDCSYIYGADYTAATVIQTLTRDFAARNQCLFFYNLKPSVSSVFEGLSPRDFVVFYNPDEIDELIKKSPRTNLIEKV